MLIKTYPLNLSLLDWWPRQGSEESCWARRILHITALRSSGLQPARLLCPLDFSGKNSGVDCRSLLQGIFLTQGSNLGLLHWRQIFHCLRHQESPEQTRGLCKIKLSNANTSNGYGNRSKAEKQERNCITDLENELMCAREGGKDGGKG